MPTSIPSVLVPYVQSCLQTPGLTLITTVLDTPANWLLLRFLKANLNGIDEEFGVSQNIPGVSPVILASFLRPYDFWLELGKKIGLDISAAISKKQLIYIDGLTVGVHTPQPTAKSTKPKSLSLSDISHALSTAKAAVSTTSLSESRVTVIFDGLDLILASQPDINATNLNTFFTETCEKFSNVVTTLSADSPLLHNIEASATPLELDHSIFLRSVGHQSAWVLQLRPLVTGHAKDVSGVLQISRGGAESIQNGQLPEGEWLYQVRGDGSVRVWSRGSE